jgi:hypothetical protein
MPAEEMRGHQITKGPLAGNDPIVEIEERRKGTRIDVRVRERFAPSALVERGRLGAIVEKS